jgi:hypothetical protein
VLLQLLLPIQERLVVRLCVKRGGLSRHSPSLCSRPPVPGPCPCPLGRASGRHSWQNCNSSSSSNHKEGACMNQAAGGDTTCKAYTAIINRICALVDAHVLQRRAHRACA